MMQNGHGSSDIRRRVVSCSHQHRKRSFSDRSKGRIIAVVESNLRPQRQLAVVSTLTTCHASIPISWRLRTGILILLLRCANRVLSFLALEHLRLYCVRSVLLLFMRRTLLIKDGNLRLTCSPCSFPHLGILERRIIWPQLCYDIQSAQMRNQWTNAHNHLIRFRCPMCRFGPSSKSRPSLMPPIKCGIGFRSCWMQYQKLLENLVLVVTVSHLRSARPAWLHQSLMRWR